MPPLPSPGNVIKVLTQGKLYDAEWLNIWHVSWSGATPDSGTLASYLSSAWMPEWDTAFGAEASTESTTDLHTAIDLSRVTDRRCRPRLGVCHVQLGDQPEIPGRSPT
jgi:hypothetical protein